MAGFEVSKTQTAGDYTGRVTRYVTDGAAKRIAIGDVVVITGGADANGVPEVKELSGTNPWVGAITGVVVGIEPDFSDENFSTVGVARSTTRYVYVIDDPDTLFEVESDATLAAADVGLNVDIISTEATSSGNLIISNYEIDGSSKVTTAATPFRIVALLEGATSGTLGDRALVRMNETTRRAGATGI